MTAPLPTPEEFRARLAEMTASELAAAGRDPDVRACIEASREHAAVWSDAVALHEALDAFDVPAPRVNIAARTMAAIAVDERSRRTPSARVLHVLASRVAVPAWAVAAALALLVASAAFNAMHAGRGDEKVAAVPAPTPIPQLIVIDPTNDSTRVLRASNGISSPMTDPIPALVVIMGVPPDAAQLRAIQPQTLDRVSDRKESSI